MATFIPVIRSLLAANSLTRSTKTSLNLLGPICATALYQLFGAELSLVLDGLSFLLAAACIFIIRMDRNVDGENRRISGLFTLFWKDFFAGMQFAWGNSAVRGIFLLMCIISLGAGAVNLLNIFLVVDILELPEDHVAWGNTCQAIGMLASAILLGVISKRVKAFNWLSIGGVGIIFLGIVLLAVSPNAWIMFASRFITGIGSTVLTVSLTTLFQYEVPEELLGRIGAVLETAPLLAMLVSVGLSGYLQSLISTRLIFIGSAVIILVAGLIAMVQLGCLQTMKKEEIRTESM
ncbi:hypothetical protein C2W64_01572 [Brevibacillus laterosporus]|nr:hypothetical protein C2W64_01572 [Brevibacillus laterosporus]